MRYCGIDVSAKPGNQQLVSLHERRLAGDLELVATFYEPGDVAAVARTVQGFGRGEAVVAIDAPSAPPADRVCDQLLYRRGLPLYPVPGDAQGRERWQLRGEVGYGLFAALAPLGRWTPPEAGTFEGAVGSHALARGRVFETYPDAIFCALLGHRPSPKRTPWGLQQRIAALKLKGIVDADGGLWHRTLDELDACAAAYAAYALAVGLGTWAGDPAEAVIVLPVASLQDRYEKLPPAGRHPLA